MTQAPVITDPMARPEGIVETVKTYIALTKPRIIELLLITTVPSMVLAAGRWPSTWLVLATLIGGSFSAAGANAINSYVDRDIDPIMRRTSLRPLARKVVPPEHALRFGVVLGAIGFVWLWATTNLLAATLSTSALFFYVFVYSIWLKRSTPQNIVIGGAAGAAPVLVGWAVVTGSLSLEAWLFFAIVFYWTPPHFWALSMKYKEDYAAAGVPMLPVVHGEERTVRSIIRYAAILFLIAMFLGLAGNLGWVYLSVAAASSLWFLWESLRLLKDPSRAMKVFHYSNIHLAALSAAMVADVLLSA
jgi:protoheme IX farnesyltransferase